LPCINRNFFRINFTNKSHTSQDFSLSKWKYQFTGLYGTRGKRRSDLDPPLCVDYSTKFKNLQLKMIWGFSIPVLVACLCPLWPVVVLIDRRLSWTQYLLIGKFDHVRNITVNNIQWNVLKYGSTVEPSYKRRWRRRCKGNNS
jgi:hypothetical protein